MEELNSKGWLIRIHEREEDTITTFLLEDGRIVNLRAIGVKTNISKNRQSMQKFSILDVEYFQSTNPYTGKLKKITINTQIVTTNLIQQNTLNLIKNLVIHFQKVDKEVFDAILFILENIKLSINRVGILFYIIRLILKEENIVMNIKSCAVCGTKTRISGFSLKDGGLLCKNHIGKYDKPLYGDFLQKIIKIFTVNSALEANALEFDLSEENDLKILFEAYLSNNLGLFADLLLKI